MALIYFFDNASYFSVIWNELSEPACALFPIILILKQKVIALHCDVRKHTSDKMHF